MFNLQETAKTISVISFTIIIILSSIKLLFRGDKNDSLKKVIGGLGVFIVAIVSDNTTIYIVALFIGGLLIASERFLLFLASIFRAESKDISNIASKFKDLTEIEIEKKREREAKALKKSLVSEPTSKKTSQNPFIIGDKELIKRYEAKILREIKFAVMPSSSYTVRYYVEVKDGPRNKQYDAVVVKKNTDSIKYAFEIKFIGPMNIQKVKEFLSQTAPLLSSNKYKTIFTIVFTDYDYNIAQEMLNLRQKQIQNHPEYGVAYFYIRDEQLDVLNDEDIEIFREDIDPFPPF